MPDETLPPGPPPSTATPMPASNPEASGPEASSPEMSLGPGETIHIGEEFGTGKKNLPPAKLVLIVLGVVALILGVYSFFNRAKPHGTGSIDNVAAVEVPGQGSMLVAITLTFHNTSEKQFWIQSIKGTLATGGKDYSDDDAAAADFDRYFQAFPALRQGSQPALMLDTKLQPGQQITGTMVVSFPVTQQAFDQRQSLGAVIQAYDQSLPVVITK
jgi:hypothetical protein